MREARRMKGHQYVRRLVDGMEACVTVEEAEVLYVDGEGTLEPFYGRVKCQQTIEDFMANLTSIGMGQGVVVRNRSAAAPPPAAAEEAQRAKQLVASVPQRGVVALQEHLQDNASTGRFFEIVTNIYRVLGVVAAAAAIVALVQYAMLARESRSELIRQRNLKQQSLALLQGYLGSDLGLMVHYLLESL